MAVGVPLLIATEVGMNVPPLPASPGVTVTVPVIVPFAPTVKLVDATLTVPLDGPDKVVAVAAVSPPSAVFGGVDPVTREDREDAVIAFVE